MSKKSKKKQTPLMRQYFDIKEKHPGTILLFRVGDFYETFSDDAELISKELGITLTKRNNGEIKRRWPDSPTIRWIPIYLNW